MLLAMATGSTRRDFVVATAAAALTGCTRNAAAPPQAKVVPLVYDATGTLMLTVNLGGKPCRLVLDTGAERSALSSKCAVELGLQLRDGGKVEGAAGVVQARSARTSIEVEGLERFDVDFTVYDLAWQDAQCVGILGAEFLRRAPFQLRYRQRQLVWWASRPPETVAMQLEHDIPRLPVSIGDVALTLRLDTGASLPPGEPAYVNVTQAEAARLALVGTPVEVWSATGTGGKKLELPVHKLPGLTISRRTLTPAFAIVQPGVGYFERADAVGFLGNAVLDKLDPFLDYATGTFAVGV